MKLANPAIRASALVLFFVACSASISVKAQESRITVDVSQQRAPVSSTLHGIFFEEISHGGEGGLYAELIQNRSFEESKIPEGCSLDSGWIIPPRTPHFQAHRVVDWKMPFEAKSDYPAWSLSLTGNSKASIALDLVQPLHAETPRSLRIDINTADEKNKVQVINEGFWGINVVKDETYELTFYIRGKKYSGDVSASLIGDDGTVLASKTFKNAAGSDWKKHQSTLRATASNKKARFHLIRVVLYGLIMFLSFRQKHSKTDPMECASILQTTLLILNRHLFDGREDVLSKVSACRVRRIGNDHLVLWKKDPEHIVPGGTGRTME
jgi:hypothetical protein